MNHAFGRTAALKAVLWTTGSVYIGYVLGLLINILIARRLDTDDFGRYAYLVWLSGVLVTVSNNGLTTTGIKFVSETLGRNSPREAANVYNWLWRLQPVCIGLVAIAFLAAMPFVLPAGWGDRRLLFAIAVLVSFSFKAWAMFCTTIAKAYGRFTAEAITSTTALVFNAAVASVLAVLKAPLEAYVFLFAATGVVYAVVSRTLLRKAGVVPVAGALDPSVKARLRKHLFWTAALAGIAAIGTRSVETFLLNHWVGAAEVGFFAIATGLTRAGIDLLVAGLSTVMMPILGYMIGTGDRERAQRVFADATRYYQFMGLLIAGVGVFWAHAIVSLMYGERYIDVTPIFRIMVATSGVLLANGAFSAILANSDNQRFRVGVAILSFAISLTVAMLLIPRYGLIGAASAQTASSILCTIVVVIGIRRFSGFHPPWRALAKQYVVALIAAAPALAILMSGGGRLTEWLSGIVYGLLLVGISLRSGVWRSDEQNHLIGLLAGYPQLRFLSKLFSTAPAAADSQRKI